MALALSLVLGEGSSHLSLSGKASQKSEQSLLMCPGVPHIYTFTLSVSGLSAHLAIKSVHMCFILGMKAEFQNSKL